MKHLKTSVVVIAALLLAVGVVNALTVDNEPQAEEEMLGGDIFTVGAKYLGGNTATTTKTYLTSGAASSTIAFICDGTDNIDMNLMLTASSTSSKLQWTYAFSYNNIDWFYQDGSTAVSMTEVIHGALPVMHFWTPATTAEQTKNIAITPVASKYCKIFYGITGANGALWSQLILKQPY